MENSGQDSGSASRLVGTQKGYSKADRTALEIALETALMLDEGRTSIPALAERVLDNESDLMGRIGRCWNIERLAWMLYRKRQRVTEGNQLRLPGFEKLPRRLTLKNGRRAPLLGANLQQLLEYRAVIWKRRDPRVEQVDRLIELLRKYKPGTTVEKAQRQEMES